MKTIIHFLFSALAVLITAYILPGVTVSGFGSAIIVAIVLGIINTILRPILIILTLPISIISLGLFVFVINAILVLLASSIIPGFDVVSFWSAMLFGIVLAIVGAILHSFEKKD
jgi:putative membrane protein